MEVRFLTFVMTARRSRTLLVLVMWKQKLIVDILWPGSPLAEIITITIFKSTVSGISLLGIMPIVFGKTERFETTRMLPQADMFACLVKVVIIIK